LKEKYTRKNASNTKENNAHNVYSNIQSLMLDNCFCNDSGAMSMERSRFSAKNQTLQDLTEDIFRLQSRHQQLCEVHEV